MQALTRALSRRGERAAHLAFEDNARKREPGHEADAAARCRQASTHLPLAPLKVLAFPR
jgi:hypothetical protein